MAFRSIASSLEIVLLSLWLGAAGFFSISIAPVLFAVLPTRTLAGQVVGRVLPIVFYLGIIAGLMLLVLQFAARQDWSFGGREISGIVMIVSCAIAQFLVSPRIERLRAEIGGSLESLAPGDARRAAFGRLHGISVAWLGLAMLAALFALVIAVRATNSKALNPPY